MPEGIEAEIYRRAAAALVGRRVATVVVDDHQQLAAELRRDLPGRMVTDVQRHGKVVLLELDGITLGLHFGMTGRLVIDDEAAIDQLEYSSRRDDPAWDRFVITFTADSGGGTMRVNDPRRWARFTIEPDLGRLGPDVFEIAVEELAERLARRRIALKAALLDQQLVAGVGNMIADEVLWHARLSPTRPANSLTDDEVGRLHATLRARLGDMLDLGGSDQGVISPAVRADQPPCLHPECAADPQPLRRDTVGSRTTIWCPVHQR